MIRNQEFIGEMEKIIQRITEVQLMELSFGSQIRVIWHNSKHHEKNEECYGVIFWDKIGYEDGLIDNRRDVAECICNDWCMVYLMDNTF